MDKIFSDVKMIISNELFIDNENILFESTFRELNLDDLDIVDLITNVEDFYNIEISDEEYESIHDVKKLCEIISDKIKKDFE